MERQPLRVAIIGMGGFAGSHHEAIRALEKEGLCRLIATCDPNREAFQADSERWEFAARGVRIFPDYLQIIDACRDQLDLVTIPTPVPLHAPMHRAVIEAGLACYLEKPPTLDYAELDRMLAVEAQAPKQTQVGFLYIVQNSRQLLKRRLRNGEFGRVRRIRLLGLWPRPASYYARASWAGRLMMDGRLVLDSIIGNAMAHYLHNLLFWAGQEDLFAWEPVVSAQAELARAHAIEGVDTVFMQGTCANGIDIRAAVTHACSGEHINRETVECEQATISNVRGGPFEIQWRDGRRETVPMEQDDLLVENFRAYFQYLLGEASRPPTRLIDSRPFVQFYDLAYVAAGTIAAVGEEQFTRSTIEGRGDFTAINGIDAVCETFLADGQFPSQQGVAWARPGGRAGIEELSRLPAVVERMREQSAGGTA